MNVGREEHLQETRSRLYTSTGERRKPAQCITCLPHALTNTAQEHGGAGSEAVKESCRYGHRASRIGRWRFV